MFPTTLENVLYFSGWFLVPQIGVYLLRWWYEGSSFWLSDQVGLGGSIGGMFTFPEFVNRSSILIEVNSFFRAREETQVAFCRMESKPVTSCCAKDSLSLSFCMEGFLDFNLQQTCVVLTTDDTYTEACRSRNICRSGTISRFLILFSVHAQP